VNDPVGSGDERYPHVWYMRLALNAAIAAQETGEPPFGAAVIGPRGEVLAVTTDSVVLHRDLTQHAETNAVRAACQMRGPDLSGCTLYATCEPCPMCFTAAWLARIGRIVIGCTMADVARVTQGQQRELAVEAGWMNARAGHAIDLVTAVLAEECLAPFVTSFMAPLRGGA
jgi:tRNA(adenine34) deaminase